MYILHRGVYQSTQDETLLAAARAVKDREATVTKCIVTSEEEN